MAFNLLKLVQQVYETFTRNDIQRSCDQAVEQIRDFAIPAFEKALEAFPTSTFSHSESRRLARLFALQSKQSGPMIEVLLSTLRTAQSILEEVSERAELLYSSHESGTALSYKKATYVQMVAICSLAHTGALATLNYLMALEAEAADPSLKATDTFSNGEIKMVVDRLPQLANVCMVLAKGESKLLGAMDKAPNDTAVSEKSYAVLVSSSQEKADPLAAMGLYVAENSHGLLGDAVSPFLMFANIFAGVQVKRYQRAQDQRDVVAMRLQLLKEQQQGNPTAALQKRIEVLSNRLNRLEAEILQMEKRYLHEGGAQ